MNNTPRNTIKSFTDLIAWQYSHKLALEIYKVTKRFPADERFSLVDQLRRAAVSVTSNIAEGFSRNSSKDKAQFYTIAIGSLYEIQSQLQLAKDLDYIKKQEYILLAELNVEAAKLVNGLKASTIKRPDFRPTKPH